ncbi:MULTISPECIES: hypothetical protein [Gammaproteobacteria]|uniref:hypothetical protein n=1 Tax=Gammaproteobacteria TaxID=1236 RepID=UPI001F31B0E4|nr:MULTISPECIES: hypothetical protein [Gammaproteobacteria]MCF4008847.1 hypothetical protein [Rheinheimera sp. UJ63]MDP5459159.1 hypothetical protein [Alishewanella sp. SMS8]
MNKITEKHIANIIKKHLGFTLLLAVAPVIFFLLIGFFEKTIYSIIPFILPISTLGAVAYFIKQVLTELLVDR